MDKLKRIYISHKNHSQPNEKESVGIALSQTRTMELGDCDRSKCFVLSAIQKMLTRKSTRIFLIIGNYKKNFYSTT